MEFNTARFRAVLIAALVVFGASGAGGQTPPVAARFPTIPPDHKHARALLEAAMRYVGPANKIVDPASGYPCEGWNDDPKKGVFLRSFTQLTAIGLYMEVLANVVAGRVETPDLPRELAQAQLARLVDTLCHDQHDPKLASEGLLVNFLDLASGRRLGPLASDVEKAEVLAAFGPVRGESLWKALEAKGWIAPRNKGREAEIRRADRFGWEYFDGPLAPFADEPTKIKVLQILDERVVLVVFGDNSNLSTSVAKTVGALLHPEVAARPEVAAIRGRLDRFLDDQRQGYARLYDPKVGLFYFGYDVHRGRLFGWEDPQGNWTTGHMDYFVNEFRGPATFVAARFGLPADAIKNLGFKVKPYRMLDGKVVHALAPWEGSAFQAMGLAISLTELDVPSWRAILDGVVDIEVDYSTRHKLPGFLSESYTGDGVQYSGKVGIPDLAVSPKPRITDAASLYTLGVAYTIAPAKVEAFLGANWPLVSTLLTDHGPWEGYNTTRREPIRFQTSAHTLSMILGLVGTGPENMKRYLDDKGLGDRLGAFFGRGEPADLLDDETRAFAWSNKDGRLRSSREKQTFRVEGDGIRQVGIAFVSKREQGVNLSGGLLSLRYRAAVPIGPIIIALKPPGDPSAAGLIPTEIFAQLGGTDGREEEIRVMLPATIGLSRVKEVVISHDQGTAPRTIDLVVTGLSFAPADSARGRPPAAR